VNTGKDATYKEPRRVHVGRVVHRSGEKNEGDIPW
jgi:hypothetical protein